MDHAVEKAADTTLQYGILGVVALAFALAIVMLWRQILKREDRLDAERIEMVKERAAWDAQEAKIRAEADAKITAAAERYATAISALQTNAQEREDEVRKEFAVIMEGVADQQSKSSDALTQMLQKFYERFVGPRPRY